LQTTAIEEVRLRQVTQQIVQPGYLKLLFVRWY
jgi:hypothetical protein